MAYASSRQVSIASGTDRSIRHDYVYIDIVILEDINLTVTKIGKNCCRSLAYACGLAQTIWDRKIW